MTRKVLGTAAHAWPRCYAEDSVHCLGAGRDDRPELAPVDHLGGRSAVVPGEPGDLLDRDAALGHDAEAASA
jgi:hypothetical protein